MTSLIMVLLFLTVYPAKHLLLLFKIPNLRLEVLRDFPVVIFHGVTYIILRGLGYILEVKNLSYILYIFLVQAFTPY